MITRTDPVISDPVISVKACHSYSTLMKIQ